MSRGCVGTAGSAQQDEGLPGNGAGSSKQRNGGSVYDMLVQEIKATKLQQKTLARQLQEVQQDLSASSKQQMLNVGSLREELTEIRQQVCSNRMTLPPMPLCYAEHAASWLHSVPLQYSF